MRKKFYLREAVTAYTKGLELNCSHDKLNAQLLCNRAHVHLQLGNNKSALEDGMQAAALDSTNFKVMPAARPSLLPPSQAHPSAAKVPFSQAIPRHWLLFAALLTRKLRTACLPPL